MVEDSIAGVEAAHRASMIESNKVIEQVANYIETHLGSKLRCDDLADHVHYNVAYLTRMFKKERKISIKEYIIQKRMLKAQTLLHFTNLPVSHIALRVGYHNLSHFHFPIKKSWDDPLRKTGKFHGYKFI